MLGAAGKMGLHLCLMLRLALGETGGLRRVIAVSRFSNAKSREAFEKLGIETLPCDLSDPRQLQTLQAVENVIFMAGAKFGTSDQPGLLRRMNEEMPAQVAEHFKTSRITAFSTGCVYSFASVDSAGSTETSPTVPVGAYAQSCLGREQAFLQTSKKFGTRIALIRLNYSVEFRYGVPVDLAAKIQARIPIDVSMGHANIIWQRDAILQTLLAHEHASADGFILNITGARVEKIRDLALRLGELLGSPPTIIGEEASTAWLSDASKAITLFGQPEVSTDQILQWVAGWQLAGLPTLNKPTGFEKRDGNF